MLSPLPYRKDIDGLRALAVLAVIAFHALGSDVAPNGFLGVDVFFVISGYLITSIIYREMLSETFRFATFYMRRIKRILPLFFTILLIGLPVSYFLFSPDDWSNAYRSSLAACFFAANIFFMRGYGYFDAEMEEKPFLHLWSLSAEEQFYFTFPLLLFLLLRCQWARRHRYAILYGLLGVSVSAAFLPLKDWGWQWDAYYIPYLRFPELLIGAILAIATADGRWEITRRAGLWSFASLVCLLFCMVAPLSFSPPLFPGLLALIPCCATALLIGSNRQSHIVSRAFARKPIVWIGKLSYSLYLWHWLVIALYRYLYGTGTLRGETLLWMLPLILGLSTVTYYAVEQPLRHRQWSFRAAISWLYVVPLLAVFALALLPQREQHDDPMLAFGEGERFQLDTMDKRGCVGDTTQLPRVLIVGDSHAGQLGEFFDRIGQTERWCAYTSAASGNPFLFDYVNPATEPQQIAFVKARNARLSIIYKEYDIIIMPIYWGYKEYYESPAFMEKLDATLTRLLRENKKVYLINSMCRVNNPRLHAYALTERGIALPLGANTDYRGEAFALSQAQAEKVRRHIKRHFPKAHWIDLLRYLPDDLMASGKPVLADANHWNRWGIRYLTHRFMQEERLLPAEELAARGE